MRFPVRIGDGDYLSRAQIKDVPEAKVARASASAFGRYLSDELGWDRYVGRAADVEERLPEIVLDNDAFGASMTGDALVLGGRGPFIRSTALSDDLVAHELAHHFIADAVPNLPETPEGHAVDEALADVYAAASTRDARIGESVVGGNWSLRDIASPELRQFDYTSLRGNRPNDSDPHLLGAPISHAAWKVGQAVGIEPMMQAWHAAVTDYFPQRLDDALGARDPWGATKAEQRDLAKIPVTDLLARATLDAAAATDGRDSALFNAIDDAWKGAGVIPRWRPDSASQ